MQVQNKCDLVLSLGTRCVFLTNFDEDDTEASWSTAATAGIQVNPHTTNELKDVFPLGVSRRGASEAQHNSKNRC